DGRHENLKAFLKGASELLKQEKPTLREAKIVATIYNKDGAEKSEVIQDLYDGSPSTKNRVVNKLIEDGILTDG
ncbi:MAG: MarR family transcriptional regulator, partial [Bdellovibrionales bacterium]